MGVCEAEYLIIGKLEIADCKIKIYNMMRGKLIGIVVMSFMIMSTYGQVQKGTFLIGGMANLSSAQSDGSNFLSGYLSPSIGSFISNHLALGLSVPYSFYKYSGGVSQNIGISPFGRYYFFTKEKSSLFVPFNVSLSNSIYNSTNSSTNTVYSTTSGSLGIGYTYFIYRSVGIETNLSYYLTKSTNNIMANSTTYSRGIKLFIGFQIYLNKKVE